MKLEVLDRVIIVVVGFYKVRKLLLLTLKFTIQLSPPPLQISVNSFRDLQTGNLSTNSGLDRTSFFRVSLCQEDLSLKSMKSLIIFRSKKTRLTYEMDLGEFRHQNSPYDKRKNVPSNWSLSEVLSNYCDCKPV